VTGHGIGRAGLLSLVVAAAGCARAGFEPALVLDATADQRGKDLTLPDRTAPDRTAPDRTAPDRALPSPPRFVQIAAGNQSVGPSLTQSFGASVTAGNLVIAAFDYQNATGRNAMAAAVADSLDDTFALVGPHDGPSARRQYVAYAIARASGACTVTVTLTEDPGGYFELRLHEYASVSQTAPFDVAASGAGTATGLDAAQTASFVTSEPNELVFGMVIDGTVSAGTGFTLRGDHYLDVTEELIATTSGTYRVTATPSGPWVATAAVFRGR